MRTVNDYCVIDLETTGYYARIDNIIEVGILKIRSNRIIDKYETLINPGYEIDDFMIDKTGITNEMLEVAPFFEEKVDEIINFIGDDLIVGHNVSFDVNFLYDEILNYKENHFLENDFIDTLRLARKFFRELENHKLVTLLDFAGIEYKRLHRALNDAEATYFLYEFIKTYVENNNLSYDVSPKKYYPRQKLSAKDIVPTVESFDEDSPLFGKTIVFTGALEKMERRIAMQIVVNHGGNCGNSVTNKTDFLVLGNLDYIKNVRDGKSTKMKKAETLILKGVELQIIPETVFYDLIGETNNDQS